MRTRWGILISGNGGTLQSLLDCRDAIDVAVVISSRPQAYGLCRARRAGVPVLDLPATLKDKTKKIEAELWVSEQLKAHRVQKIFLAGFMRVLSEKFIRTWEGKIFNIHPSLLPQYKGLNSLDLALEAGEKDVGVTIHHVVPEMDSGLHVLQRKFDVPSHRRPDLTHLWLHIQEQRVLRESLRKLS